MWIREKRKEVKPQATTKSQPLKSSDPSKPPYPYALNPDEAREYHWRWVEASAAGLSPTEALEAAKYVIEVLHNSGISDATEFIRNIERKMKTRTIISHRAAKIR